MRHRRRCHLVTTHALAEGDLKTAQAATRIAGSPRSVHDEACNRSDDGHPPLQRPERTEQILAAHDWLPPTKVAS
jgi:hypothetical protein